MNPKKLQILLVIAISLLIGYWFGVTRVQVSWKNYQPQIVTTSKEPPTSIANVDFSLFWTVWDKLTANYYDKKAIDSQKMLYGAITGMVQSIGDPYTLFLPPTQNNNFKQQLAGQFSGIGAELGLNGKQIIVVAPLEGSPSQKAGIRAGDAIRKVDGASTDGWDLGKAVDKIRGQKGTKVILTIIHKDDTKEIDIPVTRDTITVKSINGWIKAVKDIDTINSTLKNSDKAGKKIMYLRLSQFGDGTNKDWTALIATLVAQMNKDGKVKGIILDERENPGGYLADATFIAGEFLPQGTPVVIQDDGQNQTTLSVTRDGSLLDIPMVVLIDKGSASASEIVAGALRDNKRAKLVGETSFGKGTVQEALDLGNGAGLHVTVDKWLTPNKTWVNGKGLTPDVSVPYDNKDQSHDAQLEKAIETVLQ